MATQLDTDFLSEYISMERVSGETQVHVYGAIYQRPRLVQAMTRCFERGSGDAIEIGCMSGKTSAFLAQVCQQYDRTLVCVDPWKDIVEWIDYSSFYAEFMGNISPYKDCVQVIRNFSQDLEAVALIREHEYAFAFVDGDHSYQLVLADLRTVLPITKYAVASDDHRYNPGVKRANLEASKEFPNWDFRAFDDFREAWFLK